MQAPIYKNAKNLADVNYNMNQLIVILNHNVTSISQDLKWIKRFITFCSGIFTLILIAAVTDLAGWIK